MKKKSIIICLLLGAIVASAIGIADDIINRMGIEHRTAQWNIVSNLVGSFSTEQMNSYDNPYGTNTSDEAPGFQLPYIPRLSTIVSGDKTAAAKELCEYVKRYINSEEFITEYNRHRETAMPLSDQGSGLSTLKGNKIVFEKNISNYKTDTKYVAQQQKLLEENQKRIDAMVEASKKPFPGKAGWESRYPVDPSILVKKRLQEYLQLAATVDFNAELTAPDKYRIKKFVNPVYEKKSAKWKAIYRAGKEVNDVVTPFVKEWLAGEIIASNKVKMTETTNKPAVQAAAISKSQDKPAPMLTESNQEETEKAGSSDNKAKTEPSKTKKSILNKVKGKIGL